ncbi:hypothetical protein [Candidatus Reidiella endopervernicosa]|uniref:Uncharacterized protein n=1 Tax=Candidatus Reidiella endopervernicosa TaxID=2738883 RepID=A0A6N0HVT0_9GAMM|nr:hypothetical protein [Candidatus Reidiella endopervernicosa]QKQ26311.1 hypothetical protein HUE57_08455 [Candidatus Reidiella endopervernicosa]
MFEEVASFYDSNPYGDLVDPTEALRALGQDHPIAIRLKRHMEQYYGTDGNKALEKYFALRANTLKADVM